MGSHPFLASEAFPCHFSCHHDTCGIRNSHDKSFPVGVGFGSRVFVCDNMALMADHVIKRRHTANLKSAVPGIIGEPIEPMALHREAQVKTFQHYKQVMLTAAAAHHAISGAIFAHCSSVIPAGRTIVRHRRPLCRTSRNSRS
jgi:hypothetical protein